MDLIPSTRGEKKEEERTYTGVGLRIVQRDKRQEQMGQRRHGADQEGSDVGLLPRATAVGTERDIWPDLKKTQWEDPMASNSKTLESGCPKGGWAKPLIEIGNAGWRASSESFMHSANKIIMNSKTNKLPTCSTLRMRL